MENKEKEEKSFLRAVLENIALIVTCIIVGIAINKLLYPPLREDIENNGLYTICEITSLQARGYSQYSDRYRAIFRFSYESKKYRFYRSKSKSSVLKGDTLGSRHIIAFLPWAPDEDYYIVHTKVPSWFTLEAPAEGWDTEPTEAMFRALQNHADSLNQLAPNTIGAAISQDEE